VVVQGSITLLPGESCRERSGQESAEAIVVECSSQSRGPDCVLGSPCTATNSSICLIRSLAIASRPLHCPQETNSSDKSPRLRRCSPVMKRISVLNAIVLTVTLGFTNSALANPDLADLIDKAKASQNASKANLSTSVVNGKGSITYNGKKVWQGVVTNELKALSKATGTAENGLQENAEYAAVWDGNKLVWENAPGAGAALEPERKKQERELANLKRQLRN
jgi:hypothetical protein